MELSIRPKTGKVRTVAVIDLGTSSIRMAIAEIQVDGAIHTLETLTQAVGIGKDTFSKGEIAQRTIEECIDILRSYRLKLEEYDITRSEDIRVVATSSVREASNQLTFVDRVYVATGLSVQVLDAAEIHRITYRGVQPLLKALPELFPSRCFVTEVGGGNTEILMLDNGDVSWSHAYRLGSLRLFQSLQSSHVPRTRMRAVMETEIHSHIEPIHAQLNTSQEVTMVAMGSDIRLACDQILDVKVIDDELIPLPVEKLSAFVDRLFKKTEDAIVGLFHISFSDAEGLAPALLANLELARALGVNTILVSAVNLRDGLINDISEGGAWSEDFRKQIIRSAWELAHKYHVDEEHARNVAQLSQQIFRQLQAEHVLGERYETILIVSALLHEIGSYVNLSSVHKHSQYLITNSNLFGLTADDLQLVALVARYHRRALPKPTHTQYNALTRSQRVAVSKMAALLRIALALDASRTQRIKEIECQRIRKRVIISVPNVDDLSVEKIALRTGRTFFQSIFGKDVLLRTQIKQAKTEHSSQL